LKVRDVVGAAWAWVAAGAALGGLAGARWGSSLVQPRGAKAEAQ
jgi:hypothetical protein